MNNYYGLIPLSQLDDARVAEGYTDIRGFAAYTDSGERVGEVDQLLVDISANRVAAITIDVERELLNTGREPRAQVPIENVEIETAARRITVLGAGVGLLGLASPTGAAAHTSSVAPNGGPRDQPRVVLAEEQLVAVKRNVAAREVDISKRI